MDRVIKTGDLVYINHPYVETNNMKYKVVRTWYMGTAQIITILNENNEQNNYYSFNVKLCNKVKVWIE